VGIAGALAVSLALAATFGYLLYQLVKNTDAFRIFIGYLGTVSKYASTIFEGISDAIKGGDIQLAIDILISGMKVAWVDFRNWFVGLWDGLANKIRTVLSDILSNAAIAIAIVDEAKSDQLFNAAGRIGAPQKTAKLDNSGNLDELNTNLAIARFEAAAADQGGRPKDVQPPFSDDFKGGQAGTFNASAVSGLFGGGSTFPERTAKANEQMVDLLRKMLEVQQARLGGVIAG
jgi:hypothetical protein